MANTELSPKTRTENVSERPARAPLVDVYENQKEVLLIADLPGVKNQDLAVQIDADTLTIEGKRRHDPKGSPLALEFRASDYRRSFNLPAGVDRDRIEAHLEQGVLRLHLPKLAALQPRKIPIKAG